MQNDVMGSSLLTGPRCRCCPPALILEPLFFPGPVELTQVPAGCDTLSCVDAVAGFRLRNNDSKSSVCVRVWLAASQTNFRVNLVGSFMRIVVCDVVSVVGGRTKVALAVQQETVA